MLKYSFKSAFLTVIILIATFGYLNYQRYGYQSIHNQKVSYSITNTEVFQRRQLEDLPDKSIPFYGDSLVQGLAVSRANLYLENFGIGHDHSENLLRRIQEDLQRRQFSKYVVAIGINDIVRGLAVIDVYHNILAIVQSLRFADTVYVHTLLPVAATRANALKINRKVRQINELLLDFLTSCQNVVVVDTYGSLASDGLLPEGLHIGDGLHLNSTANRKWADLLSITMAR